MAVLKGVDYHIFGCKYTHRRHMLEVGLSELRHHNQPLVAAHQVDTLVAAANQNQIAVLLRPLPVGTHSDDLHDAPLQ